MPVQSSNPPDIRTLEKWQGLNQQARRGSIGDDEEWWNENLFAIGAGNLRSCWGHGPSLYNVMANHPAAPPGTKIVRMFFGFVGDALGPFQYPPPGRKAFLFLSNGAVDLVDLDTGFVNKLGSIWEPVAPYYWASAKVWRPKFFGNVAGQAGGWLLGSPQGLYAWDGTLYSPGDVAPDWLTNALETAPEAPPFYMPTGLPGIFTMEVYQNRLWVAGRDVMSYSAPSNGADFSTTGGGGSMGYFGDRLTVSYADLAQAAGYMFCFGDSSTDVVSNVQLQGQGTPERPFVTSFNYLNVDPQVGQRFPRPVGRFGRHMIQFNGAGIFMTSGGDAQPIGDRVTDILVTLDTSQYLPTMCAATMFNFRVILINGRFTDPWGITRNLILMWHPVGGGGQPFWSVASQGLELTNIGAYEQDSIITPYGTDGIDLYQLFAQPDPTLVKRLSTKAYRGGGGNTSLTIKNYKRLYIELEDNDGRGVSFTGVQTSGGGVPGGSEDVAFDMPAGVQRDIIGVPTSGQGIWCQVDLQSFSPDFTIQRLHSAVEERVLFGA